MMTISHVDLRKLYSDFWKSKNHREVPPAPVVLKEDPTTLFTSSGMQQLVPYLMGEPHPLGKRLYNIQPCVRTQDIDEVGDNRHDTFFEMLGNWSLGDYFKEEQIRWCYEFYTRILKLPHEKLYVTVFEGYGNIPKDGITANIWKSLGIPDERIFYYGVDKNWWSRSGAPDKMPVGEIGGPDSEVFYDFGTPHDPKYGAHCHPNCDCGRFMEIGNSVFIQYKKKPDGTLEELSQKNIDFGGGLERILAVLINDPDVFRTDVFSQIIDTIEKVTDKKYSEDINKPFIRVIADHIKAATFIIYDGIMPSNKEQGYVLRRLIRRSIIKTNSLIGKHLPPEGYLRIIRSVLDTYHTYFDVEKGMQIIKPVFEEEIKRFEKTLNKGLKEIAKIDKISAEAAFDLYQTYGFPIEITEEIFKNKGQVIDRSQFYEEFNRHRNLSRSASIGMFKGGLADRSTQTIKYHTATHLIHQALFDTLGSSIRQEGSNITPERLRFDFYSLTKPTDNDLKKVEKIVNEKIDAGLTVTCETLPKEEALKIGARALFRQKYPDTVKVYLIGRKPTEPTQAYSKEFCGGPHVANTKEIGKIQIYKLEKIGANLYRIYAK